MDKTAIGQRIRKVRMDRGMTQAEFGEWLGVTKPAVSGWENGNYLPSPGIMKKIADATGVTAEEFKNGVKGSKERRFEYRLATGIQEINRLASQGFRVVSQYGGDTGEQVLMEREMQ